MPINELFKQFPVIEDQFDLVAIDAIKFVDDENAFYVPIIRYMERDHIVKQVTAGLTIRTGATCESLEEIAMFLTTLTKMGFFLVDVCAYGTIYTEDMVELEDVNWNNVIQLIGEDSQTAQKPTTYLH